MSTEAIRPPGQPVSLVEDSSAWRVRLAPYAVASRRRALLDLLSSVIAYFAVSVGMVFALRLTVWLTLALAPLAAACLLRTFIIFHDCCHGSFFASRRANVWLGTALGLVVVTPFAQWRHDHAIHHASSGDLDRRGIGDLPTLTVAEYSARSSRARLAYRAFRHPLVLFGIGPLVAMIIGPRLVARDAPRRLRRSVLGTDAVLVVLAVLIGWAIGPLALLVVWLPPALISGAAGIWLFYVQHQYEDAYWRRSDDWSYADAALEGSSFLDLTPVLRFATGNIGYHHLHHLSVRIPNYNLRRAHEQSGLFTSVPVLGFWDGMRTLRFKLWDEDACRMVTFAAAAAARPVVEPVAAAA